MGERKNLVFPINAPDGTEIMPKRQWLWSKARVEQALSNGELAFLRDKDGNWSVHTKQYLKDENGEVRKSKAFSIIDNVFTQHGTNEIIDLFGEAQIFPFPKPTGLLKPLLDLVADKDAIVLDFFSGSCPAAKIERIALAEKTVFSIDDGAMFICLAKDLTPEVIKAMAEKKPVRVVCLDEGFQGNDQLKTNAVQIMKTRNITFRTV